MDRLSESCRAFGLKSTPQAAIFGLGCAAVGAIAASLSWGALDMESSVSPRLRERPHTVSARQVIGQEVDAKAGLDSDVVQGESCNHTHHSDDCAFCKAREKRAREALAAFVPLHKRPDYCVESPDILTVNVVPTGLEESLAVDQPIRGEHLVDADGRIDLGKWGKLQVSGNTLSEIKRDVETLVNATANQHRVEVSVLQQNSHVYHVINEGKGVGDTIARYPAIGCETVLDAIAAAGPINEMGKKRIWIARPTAGGVDSIIPIRWQWNNPTTMVATNPALQPGDRVFISTPPSWVNFVESAIEVLQSRQAHRAPAGAGIDSIK
jgi:protein involved in polysaccharide export with SLBB domain